jgi:flagellar biosynthesis/type III secretory pathway M-ring protein FliF/YscJ
VEAAKLVGRHGASVVITGSCGPQAFPALDAGELSRRAEQGLEAKLVEHGAQRQRPEAEALSAMRLPKVTTEKTEVLSRHLVESVKKDPAGTAQVLRTWLRDRER